MLTFFKKFKCNVTNMLASCEERNKYWHQTIPRPLKDTDFPKDFIPREYSRTNEHHHLLTSSVEKLIVGEFVKIFMF